MTAAGPAPTAARDGRIMVACAIASAVSFPLGLVAWGWSNRHRGALGGAVALTLMTALVPLCLFQGLGAAAGRDIEWYWYLVIGNWMTIPFFAFAGTPPPSGRAYRYLYYALAAVIVGVFAIGLTYLLGLAWPQVSVAWLACQGLIGLGWALLFLWVVWRFPVRSQHQGMGVGGHG